MITFSNVTKRYRGTKKPALDNVSLQIDRGEFVFIVGSSGSGKSSCLRLMLREDQATGGQVHVLGHDLSKLSSRKVPLFRRNLGMVFQDFRLLQNKNVYENVAFSLQVIGKSRGFIQEAVPDVLQTVGLAGKEKRYPHELSGGEQQRVAIARAVVNKPAILLADEPTGNLDPATSLGIMQLLQEINAAGTTIVMATHEAAFVDIMRQRVIELSEGVVVRDEQSGGYGETASIPLEDLRKAGLRAPLRVTTETVVKTLNPAAVPAMDSSDAGIAGAAAAGVAAAGAVADDGAAAGAVAAAGAETEPATDAAAAAALPEVTPAEPAGFNSEFIDTEYVNSVLAEAAGGDIEQDILTPSEPLLDVAESAEPEVAAADPIAAQEQALADLLNADATAVAGIAERLGLEDTAEGDEEVGPVK